MYTNNAEQFFSFFIFIIVGVIISFVFDIFRILRKTIKTSDFITYIEDNEVPMFNKVASVYKATTKNGKPFEFCYMQVQGLFIEFNYIEIEFNSIEEYQGFNFDEYFHFINKKDVKDMSNNNAFRMEKLYKLFGTK